MFTHCVDLLNSDQLQSQTAQELVGKLLVEVGSSPLVWSFGGFDIHYVLVVVGQKVESLSGSSMVRVAEQLIDCVKRGTVENGR